MHYKFPTIESVADVAPHLEGYSEFFIADREQFRVANFHYKTENTFDMIDENDLGGAIRRECRGLIFDLSGKLISRPYHKFFNVNEREETHVSRLDLSVPHVVLEKMDGSMVRPLIFSNGVLRLGTKMGITDTSDQAEMFLNSEQKVWLAEQFRNGITPILEFIAPSNRIVLFYEEPKLVLTAMRVNLTGEYFMPEAQNTPFELVKQYGSVNDSIEDYLERNRAQTGREGDVIRFANGQMLKQKCDWYCLLHKTKDNIRYDRNIAVYIVNEELDDLIPMLDENDLARVKEYQHIFWEAFNDTVSRIHGLYQIAMTVYGGEKKRVALELVPNLLRKTDAKFLFSAMDGKNIEESVLEYVKRHLGSIVGYNEMFEWLSGRKVQAAEVANEGED